MQKYFFHNNHDIRNKLLVIIHAEKISIQKETNFSQTKPQGFTRASCFETYKSRKSSHHIHSTITISQTQEKIIPFVRKQL